MEKVLSLLFTLIPQKVNVTRTIGEKYTRVSYIWLGRIHQVKVKGQF